MTLLGALAIALTLCGVALRRPALPAAALGFGAGVPASAGLAVGPATLSVFVVVAAVVGCTPAPRRGARLQDPAVSLLVTFVCWALVVTAIGPWTFAGIAVLTPGKGIDAQVHAPSALQYSIGNASQVAYLLASVVAARFLWRTGTAPIALLVAAWTGSGLSAARGLLRTAGLDRTAWLFDTLPVDYSGVGDARLRGVFAEPSELAAFSLAIVAFAAVGTARADDARTRITSGTLFTVAAGNLLASASGTAVAAGCIVAVALGGSFVARFVASGGRHAGAFTVAFLTIAFASVASGTQIVDSIMQIVEEKVGSQSFDSRTAADELGYRVLVETRGMGAGLGSDRSSSFLVTLFATTGVVGVMTFGAATLTLLFRSARTVAATPVAAALLGLLVAKAVSAPDLATPLLWVLIATGIHFAARRGGTGLAGSEDDSALIHQKYNMYSAGNGFRA
ncbi:hypothetical protein [Curtobacterium sp. MCPF17_046]|uniref:hypothetical protein n=1 Tax=Curtobacterium sp. MCPF17_046 TaxID=2175663 RepID=UPI000D9BF54A|nr:hypothetical protein [Curtobacterium sp. MCPF17_046]PYY39093.1 hypothetical protein DEJ32_09125 [Curtobacterium sp. MCPF17_046]